MSGLRGQGRQQRHHSTLDEPAGLGDRQTDPPQTCSFQPTQKIPQSWLLGNKNTLSGWLMVCREEICPQSCAVLSLVLSWVFQGVWRRCQLGLSLRRTYRCGFGEAEREEEGWEQEDQSLLELAELWLLRPQENGREQNLQSPPVQCIPWPLENTFCKSNKDFRPRGTIGTRKLLNGNRKLLKAFMA